jgi:hypothetical protein
MKIDDLITEWGLDKNFSENVLKISENSDKKWTAIAAQYKQADKNYSSEEKERRWKLRIQGIDPDEHEKRLNAEVSAYLLIREYVKDCQEPIRKILFGELEKDKEILGLSILEDEKNNGPFGLCLLPKEKEAFEDIQSIITVINYLSLWQIDYDKAIVSISDETRLRIIKGFEIIGAELRNKHKVIPVEISPVYRDVFMLGRTTNGFQEGLPQQNA